MDGSAILYAGLGAGLGSLIGGLIASRFSNTNLKSFITILPMIIGWQGTVALYKNMKLPRVFPMEHVSVDAENPGLSTLKENSPEDYRKLIKLLDEPSRKGKLEQKHLDEFRSKFSYLLEEKRSLAPPELLRKTNALAAELFRILRVKSPEICTAQANGRSFPVLTDIAGKEYALKEQKLLAQIFNVRTSSNPANAKLGEKIYSEILKKNVIDLGIKTLDPAGDDVERVKSEHRLVCKLFESSMLAVNLLDDDSVRNVAAFTASETLKN